jgi:hypothetical protein
MMGMVTRALATSSRVAIVGAGDRGARVIRLGKKTRVTSYCDAVSLTGGEP